MTLSFESAVVRHELAVRRAEVVGIAEPAAGIRRITLAGADLAGFTALGPGDHVKLCFPDPATGALALPTIGEDGIRRPVATLITRDYTPLEFRPADATTTGVAELDLDFVIHGTDGPASAWAMGAAVGDPLGIAGPRGSRLVPEGITGLLLVVDETALPAATRWIRMAPADAVITVIASVAEGVETYFDDDVLARVDSVEWLFREDGAGQLEEAVRSLRIDDGTLVFLAGEAGELVPIRRYLRHELGLPKQQVRASGYWKRGVTNLDHHAPIDPTDPD